MVNPSIALSHALSASYAGVMALPDQANKDGYDVQMATNHLSHFLLTRDVMPLLEKAAERHGEARVVQMSSEARKGAPVDAKYYGKNGGNLGGDGTGSFFNGPRWQRYGRCTIKLAFAITACK